MGMRKFCFLLDACERKHMNDCGGKPRNFTFRIGLSCASQQNFVFVFAREQPLASEGAILFAPDLSARMCMSQNS
jgi:hypothetical protein